MSDDLGHLGGVRRDANAVIALIMADHKNDRNTMRKIMKDYDVEEAADSPKLQEFISMILAINVFLVQNAAEVHGMTVEEYLDHLFLQISV